MTYQFGPWQYLPNLCLLRADQLEVELEPLLHKLLMHLLTWPNQIVTRQELIDDVWQQNHVDDNAINRAISELRKQLSHPSFKGEIVKTHYRKGYSISVAVTVGNEPLDQSSESAQFADINEYKTASIQLPESSLEGVKVHEGEEEKLESKQGFAGHSKSKIKYMWLLLGLVVIVIGISLVYEPNRDPDLTLPNQSAVTFTKTAATWQLGQEKRPFVSPDSRLFSFISTHDGKSKSYVKSLANNRVEQLKHKDYLISALSWQPQSALLLAELVNFSRNECFFGVFNATQFPTIRFEKSVKTCEGEAIGTAQLSLDQSRLFYIDKDPQKVGYELREFNLTNKTDKTLISSHGLTYGIRQFEVSDNGEMIVYRREEQGQPNRFYVYNMLNREHKKVFESHQNAYMSYMGWYKPNESLVTVDNGEIVIINILDNSKRQLPVDPSFYTQRHSAISTGQLLYSGAAGSKYLISQIEKPFSIKEMELTNTLSSDGDNYFPLINEGANYFVSNRTGIYQYWMEQNQQFKQLSDFSQNFTLYPPAISKTGRFVAYRKNNSFEILNTETQEVEVLTSIDGQFVNTYEFSPDERSLYLAYTTDQVVQIWQYQMATSTFTQVTKNGAWHMLKDGNGELYYSNKNQVVGISNNVNIEVPFDLAICRCQISISKQFIYAANGYDEISRFNLTTGQLEKKVFPNLTSKIFGLSVSSDDSKILIMLAKQIDTQIKRINWMENQ